MRRKGISEHPMGDYRKKRLENRKVKLLMIAACFLTGLIVTYLVQGELYPFKESHLNAKSHQLEGLWAYESLKPGGAEKEFQLTGYFLFHDGCFVQQSINDGDPFENQGGMAHAGPYRKAEKGYRMTAEIGISVSPTRTPPLSVRLDTQHEIFPEFSGDKLFLTFGSGTLQSFRRIDTEKRKIHNLDKGYLAFAGNYFILVSAWQDNSIAGSGMFKKEGNTLQLYAERWFSVMEGKIKYLKNEVINASFDAETLSLPDGIVFHRMNKTD